MTGLMQKDVLTIALVKRLGWRFLFNQDGTIHTLWFEISVDETHQMEVFQSRGDFSCIEASGVFRDALSRSGLQG